MVHLFGCIPGVQRVTKRCRPSWLTNDHAIAPARIWAQMRGGGGVAGSQPMSTAACPHGGQINCGDLTPYLTYVCWCPLSIFLQVKVCLPLTAATFCSSCYCWKLFSKFLFSDFFVLWLLAPSANLPVAACLSSVSYLPDTDTAGPPAHLSAFVLVQLYILVYSSTTVVYCWHIQPLYTCHCWCIHIEKWHDSKICRK